MLAVVISTRLLVYSIGTLSPRCSLPPNTIANTRPPPRKSHNASMTRRYCIIRKTTFPVMHASRRPNQSTRQGAVRGLSLGVRVARTFPTFRYQHVRRLCATPFPPPQSRYATSSDSRQGPGPRPDRREDASCGHVVLINQTYWALWVRLMLPDISFRAIS